MNLGDSAQPTVNCLLQPLPDIQYVEEPAVIKRFMILLYPDGRIIFKGSREDIDRFIEHCTEQGLELNVGGISLCG